MLPLWALIAALIIVGFIFLLWMNGRRDVDEPRIAQHKKIEPIPEEPEVDITVDKQENQPEKKPVDVKQMVSRIENKPIEEATYLDHHDSTIGGDFYEEVAELFLEALEAQPERQDLRLKLIDVYFDSGNKNGFVREATAYKAMMRSKNDPDWENIQSMGKSLVPADPLFGGSGNTALAEAAAIDIEDEDKPVIRRFGDGETAKQALEELATQYKKLRNNPNFYALLDIELIRHSGRPAPWLFAKRISEKLGGAQIYIKREDLNTGFPRLRTQLIGQAWIASQLGKEKLLFAAENGEEAVIAARAAACMGLQCLIYISAQDGKYRESHKFQVQLMGAEFVETLPGDKSGDIRYAALDTWISSADTSFMMLNLRAGPHPYPSISNDLQAVIGRECLRQVKGKLGKYPKAVFARGAGSPDAIGFVEPFLSSKETEIHLVSPESIETDMQSDLKSKDDLYHLLITNTQKLSANKLLEDTEYPRVDREHSLLAATGRIKYVTGSLDSAKSAIKEMAKSEGVIFPMGSAHVLADAIRYARIRKSDEAIIVMLAERLDKDLLLVGNDIT